MEMVRIIEHVVQVRGLDRGFDLNLATLRRVVISAVASNAGRDVLTHVRGKDVCLIGGRAGIHVGSVVPAVRFLVAVRLGFSAVCLRKLLRLRIRAPGVPICLLVDFIAGVDVHVNTGDKVYQKAYWDAGGANAEAEKFAKAYGGEAESNGDQKSYSGHDTSNVDASTTANQTNILSADMSQHVAAGIGGNGGNNNTSQGGEVEIKASIESANLNNVLNDSDHFHVDDFVHV